MLQRLYIENFAIVDNLEVEFSPGFTTITGETGAGKSIIIDALSAIIGERISTEVIRHGENRAEVIADIDIRSNKLATSWLDEQQYDLEDTVIIRRIIAENGGRATLNGKPVTMGQLKEFGEFLVEIHGQHAHQRLMRVESYRTILDEYGDYRKELAEVFTAFNELDGLAKRRAQLLKDTSGDIEETLSFLGFQIEELNQAELEEIEFSELDNTLSTLSHANDLISGLEKVQFILGDNDDANAQTMITDARNELEKLMRYDESLSELVAVFDQVDDLLGEICSEARRKAGNINIDAEELNRLENILNRRMDLARKHRTTPAELPQILTTLVQRHSDLSSATEELSRIDKNIESAEQTYHEAATLLSTSRKNAATAFGERITQEIEELGMGKATVRIEVDFNQNEKSAYGSDSVHFLIATNPGETHKPIHRIASGGELSRIALAIEVANSNQTQTPTMVFDEVDVGIGGATADIVGSKIKSLGDKHQIICITHLPQVAAHGSEQFQVAKTHGDDATHVSINKLNNNERIEELARMLGGREITVQTRQLAEELLGNAVN